jgi:hypothetical protein
MELLLLRDIFANGRTLGRLLLGGVLLCYTCEDPDRGLDEDWTAAELASRKVPGDTCIAVGLHSIVLEDSPKYGPDTLTIKVPGHRLIRIHAGNTEADTEGCLLPGTGRTAAMVTDSREALVALRARLVPHLRAGGDLFVRIERDAAAWAVAPFNPAKAA